MKRTKIFGITIGLLLGTYFVQAHSVKNLNLTFNSIADNRAHGFHLNADQSKAGSNSLTYHKFAPEVNFNFASAIQEMLLQTHKGIILIFPAVPPEWKNIYFEDLRTEGGFLVSARKEAGILDSFTISAPEGGIARIRLPFPTFYVGSSEKMEMLTPANNKELLLKFEKGGFAVIRNGYE